MRTISAGLTSAVCYVTIFLAGLTFPWLMESKIGAHGAFFIYSVFALAAAALAVLFLPETRGKSLEEIEEFFEPGGRRGNGDEQDDPGAARR